MNAPGIRPLPALAIASAILVVGSRLFPAMWSEVPEAPRRSAQSRTAERVARTQPPQVGPANRAQALAVHGAGGRLTGDDSLTTGSLPNRAAAAPARDLSARVVIKAEQTVALSAELNARILRIPFKEGDRFQAGAVLIEFVGVDPMVMWSPGTRRCSETGTPFTRVPFVERRSVRR